MAKLIMLKGLPASGKSTRAKEIVTQGNFVRVNRDLLREMLHFGKWSGLNEKATVAAEIDMVRSFLVRKHQSVVVDDCNLNPKNTEMWRAVAEELGASFQVETIDTSFEECIMRDLGREKSVGRDVIVGMALQYGLYPVPEKGFVLCDLDGTLCDIRHRLEYAKGETKDWGKFFAGIPDDKLRVEVADMVLSYEKEGHQVIFVSARPDTYRKETQEWLDRMFEGYHPNIALIMRKSNDKRQDTEVKQQVYDTYFKGKYPIEVIIDDRPSVIRMWRENGLKVIDVGPGIEF